MAKPNRLLIVGAGAMGRLALEIAMDMPDAARDWEIGGFLDDRPDILNGYGRPFGILGDPASFKFADTDRVVCAIASPEARLAFCEKLVSQGARFTNLVHPTAIVGRHSRMGWGCILAPYAILDSDAVLGNHVIMYARGIAGHDSVVGDGCLLAPQAVLCGGCTLGRGVFIGTNATVNEGTVIGDHACVASGSVAAGRIPAKAVMMGVPARPIRQWAQLLRSIKT